MQCQLLLEVQYAQALDMALATETAVRESKRLKRHAHSDAGRRLLDFDEKQVNRVSK